MGINLARGAKNVLSALPNMNLSSVSATLYDISMIVQGMGGKINWKYLYLISP